MFKFKQFSVDQTGCAMKINTDGVLLGALADADKPLSILDIGTGTGVIALMLAQRFTDAHIDAVELDESAAITAGRNFKDSPFADRLELFSGYTNRRSLPSILPYTPFNGLNAASLSANSSVPKSPACHISSQFSKCLKTASSR